MKSLAVAARFTAEVAVLVIVGACSVTVPEPAGPSPVQRPLVVSVDTPDGVVGLFRDANGTHLVLDGHDTGAKDESSGAPTVHLVAFGGETGRVYNSFVFGLAPSGASEVEFAGMDQLGGAVVNGLYVVAIKAKDINPIQLNWTFRDRAGAIVKQGSNITP